MGLVVGLGRRTGAEQPGLDPFKMYDNLALNNDERRPLQSPTTRTTRSPAAVAKASIWAKVQNRRQLREITGAV